VNDDVNRWPRKNCGSARILGTAFVLLFINRGAVLAQVPEGVSREVIEEWIVHHVPPQRVWKTDIRPRGLAFALDSATEAHLVALGARSEWLEVLRHARSSISTLPASVAPQPMVRPSSGAQESPRTEGLPRTAHRSRMTRDELRPIYFGRESRITVYIDAANLRETGGIPAGYLHLSNGDSARFDSRQMQPITALYGMVVGISNVALDMQGHFGHGLLMVNMGLAWQPFIPFGASGARLVLGVTPFMGIMRQTVGYISKSSVDTSSSAISINNFVLGGDIGLGLAYHWKPGEWLSVEGRFRLVNTVKRDMTVPGEYSATSGILWKKWSANGGMLRVSIGF
jgi:hypothetical protein